MKIQLYIFCYSLITILPTFGANPPTESCEPSMADVEWEKSPQSLKFDLAPIGAKLAAILTFIPGGVHPYLSGEFELSTYSKTGCCDPEAKKHVVLEKYEASGTAGIGVDTGRVPIPGLSLPFGAGGAYIGASTDISLTLSGSVEDTCADDADDLCCSVELAHNVSIYGGANIAGDTIDIRLTGSGSIKGGATWCKSSGWDLDEVCGSASAKLTLVGFNRFVHTIPLGETPPCE